MIFISYTRIAHRENMGQALNSNSHFEKCLPHASFKEGIPRVKSPFEGGLRGDVGSDSIMRAIKNENNWKTKMPG